MKLQKTIELANERFAFLDSCKYVDREDIISASESAKLIAYWHEKYYELCQWKPEQSQRWAIECMNVIEEPCSTLKKLYKKYKSHE